MASAADSVSKFGEILTEARVSQVLIEYNKTMEFETPSGFVSGIVDDIKLNGWME